jgi:hypothetical protein
VDHLGRQPRRQPLPDVLQDLVLSQENEPPERVLGPGSLNQFDQFFQVVEDAVLPVN